MKKKVGKKLWLLTRIDQTNLGVDEAHGFIIRAEFAETARAIAQSKAGDEVRDGLDWRNPKQVKCRELTNVGGTGVVMRDFNAG